MKTRSSWSLNEYEEIKEIKEREEERTSTRVYILLCSIGIDSPAERDFTSGLWTTSIAILDTLSFSSTSIFG